MACRKKRTKNNLYCIGDLNIEAVFYDREIEARTDDEVGIDENFENGETRWVGVESVNGIDVFDETNIAIAATHRIIARYDSTIFSKRWIVIDSKYFKVLQRTNVAERKRWIEYLCLERGVTTRKVNKA